MRGIRHRGGSAAGDDGEGVVVDGRGRPDRGDVVGKVAPDHVVFEVRADAIIARAVQRAPWEQAALRALHRGGSELLPAGHAFRHATLEARQIAVVPAARVAVVGSFPVDARPELDFDRVSHVTPPLQEQPDELRIAAGAQRRRIKHARNTGLAELQVGIGVADAGPDHHFFRRRIELINGLSEPQNQCRREGEVHIDPAAILTHRGNSDRLMTIRIDSRPPGSSVAEDARYNF